MWYKDLFIELEKLKNDFQAKKMSKYMQDKFRFLGIPKPKLNEFIKHYFNKSKGNNLDWNFIDICWNKDYREAQYIGINYLMLNIKRITIEDFNKIKELIINKSWWETVDSLDFVVGSLVEKNKELEYTMIEWSTSDDIWLRRVAIDFQQKYKEKTNTELLEKIIINSFGSAEFFINKAIGWSLRDYSKTNLEWVRNFIYKYEDKMDKLSIKEASKYI